jgi:hypothetical protein
MAGGIGVWTSYDTVTVSSIAKATNTPGGGPYEYMNDFGDAILGRARRYTLQRVGQDGTPGVNHPLNATHRGAQVGMFELAWYQRRFGNQSELQRQIANWAGHAEYVEFGRSRSNKVQRFGWVHARQRVARVPGKKGGYVLAKPVPGAVMNYRRTNRRAGKYILRDATRYEARKRGVAFL